MKVVQAFREKYFNFLSFTLKVTVYFDFAWVVAEAEGTFCALKLSSPEAIKPD